MSKKQEKTKFIKKGHYCGKCLGIFPKFKAKSHDNDCFSLSELLKIFFELLGFSKSKQKYGVKTQTRGTIELRINTKTSYIKDVEEPLPFDYLVGNITGPQNIIPQKQPEEKKKKKDLYREGQLELSERIRNEDQFIAHLPWKRLWEQPGFYGVGDKSKYNTTNKNQKEPLQLFERKNNENSVSKNHPLEAPDNQLGNKQKKTHK